MSKRSLMSSLEVDRYQKVRNMSRTRLRRLETKEKKIPLVDSVGEKTVGGNGKDLIENLRKLKSIDEPPNVEGAVPALLSESPSLDVSHDDPENDEFAGLRFCSQESGLDKSGDSDSQCEVRWDCYSPHTVKQLKKLRGQYSAEGVKRIVANFNDAHVKPRESSTLKLLPMPGPGPSAPFKEVVIRNRVTNRKHRRVTSHKAVQEMILLLQNKIAKKEKGSEATRSSSEEISSEGHAGSVGSVESRDNVRGDMSREISGEDCWSDDDLFQDNSFLIEATQNPEKFINTSFDVSSRVSLSTQSEPLESVLGLEHEAPSAQCINVPTRLSIHGYTLENVKDQPRISVVEQALIAGKSPHSSFIPPSRAPGKIHSFNKCAGQPKPQTNKQSNAITDKTGSSTTQSSRTLNNRKSTLSFQSEWGSKSVSSLDTKTFHDPSLKPSSSYNTKFASSVNKFVNQSSQNSIPSSVSQNHPSSQHIRMKNSHMKMQSPPQWKVKTSFKKFNSFQEGHNTKDPVYKNESSHTGWTSSFHRTVSFDSIRCAATVKPNNTASVISSKICNDNRNKSSLDFRNSTSKPPWSKGNTPVNRTPASKEVAAENDNVVRNTAADDGFDMSLTEDVLQQLLEIDEAFDSQADILATGQPSTAVAPAYSCGDMVKAPILNKCVNALSRTAVAGSSLHSSMPVRLLNQRRSLVEPSSSTPVKGARACPTGTTDEVISDSGTELFDSFLNEEIYESQILPFMEKIESETTTCLSDAHAACVELYSSSPVKCSPEEIEQKRQAALQRRSVRLSQTKKKISLR